MSQMIPANRTAGGLPEEWADEQIIEDVVLYDMARHRASVLSSLLLQRQRSATTGFHRRHWRARRRLVKQQAKTMSAEDRAGMIAQHQAWSHEIQALTGQV